MKRFLIFVILLFSLSAVFATEEQVFKAIELILKERPQSDERLQQILQDNMFIPLPTEKTSEVAFQNYFGDIRVEASYLIPINLDDKVRLFQFIFFTETDSTMTMTVQKLLSFVRKTHVQTKILNENNWYSISYLQVINNMNYGVALSYSLNTKNITLTASLVPKQN